MKIEVNEIHQQVLQKYWRSNLTDNQVARMLSDLDDVCHMFKDGYDRARALEIQFNWAQVDADLVKILDSTN